jgi:hypothetical protein
VSPRSKRVLAGVMGLWWWWKTKSSYI